MRLRLFAVLLCLTVLAGCSTLATPDPSEHPEMPSSMPDDFAFSLLYGINSANAIDTFNSVIVKDLVQAGTVETNLTLSNEHMQAIYETMRQINILRELHFNDSRDCQQTPYSTDLWQIRVNGKMTTFQWSEEHCVQTSDEQQLVDLRNQIAAIVQSTQTYQALPEAVGGYD